MTNTIYTISGYSPISNSWTPFGFFLDAVKVREAVETNLGDIHEGQNVYVVIEAYSEGIQMIGEKIHWFEWIDGKYVMIDEPKRFRPFCNLAM